MDAREEVGHPSSQDVNSNSEALDFLPEEEVKVREEFVRQLPKEESTIEDCPICLEAYGELGADNSIVEHAVRLPCNHIMGSKCITTWLCLIESEDECPLCRSVVYKDPDWYWYCGDGSDADQAVMILAEREPAWTLEHLRAYLRLRLEPNAPSTKADIEQWWRDYRHQDGPPDTFEHRELLAGIHHVAMYKHLETQYQMPPLNECRGPSGIPTPDNMDTDHEDAYFHVLEGVGAYAHPFWHATTKGASNRQIHDLMCQETYIYEFLHADNTAPSLGAWTGMLNNGIDRVRDATLESGHPVTITTNRALVQASRERAGPTTAAPERGFQHRLDFSRFFNLYYIYE